MTTRLPEISRPRLLVLTSTYPRWKDDHEPGFVHELSRRLLAEFEVVVVTPNSPGAARTEVMDGVRVHRYRYAPTTFETLVFGGGIATRLKRSPWKALLLPGFVIAQYFAARKLVKRSGIDVIHAHWLLPQGLVASILAKRFSVPYVVTSHGGDLFGLKGRIFRQLKRAVAASASTMTVVSSAMSEEASRSGIHAPRLHVIPMGADLQNRFVVDGNVVRESDRLLFVGRLVPKKGLVHLIDALPPMLAERPQLVLDVVGFGPELSVLQKRVDELGLAQHVNFLGAMAQHRLPAFYRRAALFVAPFVRDSTGDQEGLPVALMEAIGCGCPVVAGDVPGLRDALGPVTSQVTVDPTDRDALVRTILDALADPVVASERARSVLEASSSRLDWSVVATGYSEVLWGAMESGYRNG